MQNYPTIVPVVAAALIDGNGRVLMQQRPAHKHHGGLWEFPGGKVEPAETLETALIREIAEELAVTLDPLALEPFSFASRAEQPHVVMLYICHAWQGDPQAIEAPAIGWFALQDLSGLAKPPLDVTLSAALQERLKR